MLTVENEMMAKCQFFSMKPYFLILERLFAQVSLQNISIAEFAKNFSHHLLNTGYIRFESQIKTNVYTNAHSKC